MISLPTIPQTLILELTARCNYHCPWCYCVWHETGVVPRNLPLTTWKSIIQDAIGAGVHNLVFTGGEVTLRQDWREILSFARECSKIVRLSLYTNGSRITEQDLLFCQKHNVSIDISLQGLRSYGTMTGTRRSYQKTLKVLMMATEIHHPCSVGVTVTRQNLYEIEDIYSAIAISGAAVVQFNAMMLAGKAQNMTDLALHPEEWRSLKTKTQTRMSHAVFSQSAF